VSIVTVATFAAAGGELGSLQQKMQYAETLAASGLLPAQYRKNPANVLFAVEYGESLGLSPIQAIQGIHVIDGKPSASASLISSLVRRAGHRIRVESTPTSARAEIVRFDDPDFTFVAEWSLERAGVAGLTSKAVWKQYPAAMLKARAISEVARDACPEALAGINYTPEELGAPVDGSGAISARQVVPSPAQVVLAEAIADEVAAAAAGDGDPDRTADLSGEAIVDAVIVNPPAGPVSLEALWAQAQDPEQDPDGLRSLYREASAAGLLGELVEVDGVLVPFQQALVDLVQRLATPAPRPPVKKAAAKKKAAAAPVDEAPAADASAEGEVPA
jgi:hypothetical protein